MKLKRLPEDFQVVELSDVAPTAGPFALYRLVKRGLGTPEAAAAVARHWKLPLANVAYGGLKDRHAVTEQFVTIWGGPRRGLEQEHLRLEYLGQCAEPFSPGAIRGNRFRLALRDWHESDRDRLEASLAALRRDGAPNYFDEQRFGSLGDSGEFIASAWCAGDWERTLRLALADPNRHDTPRVQRQKQLLTDHWGDWRTVRSQLDRPVTDGDRQLERIVDFLCARPADFRGALARIAPSQRGLYLSSYQSFLWNRLLAALLQDVCEDRQLTPLPIGPDHVPFFLDLDERQRQVLAETELPLPSARQHLEAGPIADLVHRTLAEAGVALRELRVKYPRDSFFAKGNRRVLCHPQAFSHAWQPDELHDGRLRLDLRFELPRGSYATIIVKRLAEM